MLHLLTASIAAAWGFLFQPSIVVVTPPAQVEVLPVFSDVIAASPSSTEIVVPLTKNPRKSAIRITPLSRTSSTPKTAKTETPGTETAFTATAKGILDNTAFSVNSKIDGTYWLGLRTATGANSEFNWDLLGANIGGSAGIPKFDVSFSCNPQPIIPSSGAPDQNPVFDFNTSYTCVIALTDSQQRKESKNISFKTGAGRIVVKNSALNMTLKSDKSTNGFVFDNQSGAPVTVTDLMFDVSFLSLNTGSPIVLRFTDPVTETSFGDHPLQDIPADPSNPRRHGTTGLNETVSFAVKPGAQRMLPVEVLGVQPIIFGSIEPEVKITLQQITTDHPEVKTMLASPVILWTCVPFDSTKVAQALPNEENCR